MKKLLSIAVILVAVIAIDLLVPQAEVEAQMATFLKNNLYKVMHFVNLKAIA